MLWMLSTTRRFGEPHFACLEAWALIRCESGRVEHSIRTLPYTRLLRLKQLLRDHSRAVEVSVVRAIAQCDGETKANAVHFGALASYVN